MGVQMIGLVVLTLLPELVVYLVRASGLGNETTNSTDFMPGSFEVRLVLCLIGVVLIGGLWSWRLRRKYGGPGATDADDAERDNKDGCNERRERYALAGRRSVGSNERGDADEAHSIIEKSLAAAARYRERTAPEELKQPVAWIDSKS